MNIVETVDVKKTYQQGKVEVTALGGVSLSIQKGSFVALAGPSGSGKTTLLNMIGGLDSPDSGRIVVNGNALEKLMQVQRIHGITDEMLRNQPKPDEVIPRLRDFLGDSIIVAHNARFDVEFLRHEFNRLSLRLKNRSACTLKMSRQLYPGLSNHRLDTVYQYLFGEIETDIRRHRALDDAKMAARIWLKMVKQ